jgi:phosphatidylglycerol:prolipoprotein diacylglycerol transferase
MSSLPAQPPQPCIVQAISPWSRLIALLNRLHDRTILFHRGRFIFVTYGLLMASAFVLGTSAALTYHARAGRDPLELIRFTVLLLFPSVVLGARLFSVLLEWRQLFKRPLEILLKPGYMLHGGVAGGALAMAGYSHVTGTPMLHLLDAWAFALPLGEAVARVGCHVYGCCWGKPTDGVLGITYHSRHAKVVRCVPRLRGRRIFPAQLLGSAAYLLQFLVFLVLLPVLRMEGLLVALYLLSHPILRVLLERFREDDRGRLIGPITHTNLYSAVQFVAGGAVLFMALAWARPVALAAAASLTSRLAQPELLGHLVVVALLTAGAFGVHLDQVGSWVTDPSDPRAA